MIKQDFRWPASVRARLDAGQTFDSYDTPSGIVVVAIGPVTDALTLCAFAPGMRGLVPDIVVDALRRHCGLSISNPITAAPTHASAADPETPPKLPSGVASSVPVNTVMDPDTNNPGTGRIVS